MLAKIKNLLSKPEKVEKRKVEKGKVERRNVWYPFLIGNTDPPVFNAGALPSVRRAIGLYANLLVSTPLKCEDSDELPRWLEHPCNYLSRTEWLLRLCENYFVDGNFYCYINKQLGEIKSLPPFLPSTIYQYSRSRDPSDPLELENPANRYYQSSYESENGDKKTSEYLVEDIFHIKNSWGNAPDMLNGLKLAQVCSESVGLGLNSLDSAFKYARNFFLSPQTISGLTESDDSTRATLRSVLETFTEEKQCFLTLEDSVKLAPLSQNNLAALISIVSSIGSTGIARIFGIPSSLLEREDQANVDGGAALKESFRFWVRNSGRSFLQTISEAFSEVSGKKIRYLWKSHQMSDMRESSQTLPALKDAGFITQKQGEEWLK